ncbi:MAG TPA: PhzF family phenazine biosynthesis protein [Gemmatimonadaceae bacterium]|nr:PhzF family phenazine biosynthesis protein [Gemmatimonadaceae bacterium]
MRHRYYTLDVFTSRRFGGNQLAVFPFAHHIPEHALGPIAREFNYSETVFLYPPDDPAHTRRARIFTPGEEIPFAGHPTVGAAHLLAAIGEVPLAGDETRIVLEERVGAVSVLVRLSAGAPVFAQLTAAKLPEVGPPPPARAALAGVLSLDESDFGDDAPEAVSCGLPFLFVPVRSRDAVRRARVRMEQWERTLATYWAPQLMVFWRASADVLHARVFVPGLAVPEDPATGSAAAALGGYLAARDSQRDGTLRWTLHQGEDMGRPSLIEIEADKRDGHTTAVRCGGSSVLVCEGTLSLE